MSRFLSNIIGKYPVFDDPDKIILLDKWMNYPNISNADILKDSIQSSSPIIELPNNTPINPKIITPHPNITSVSATITMTHTERSIKHTRKPKPDLNIITPNHTDTLFWSMYIAKYGYSDYVTVGTRYKNKEIEKKQDMIDRIKKNPTLVKTDIRKISKVCVQETLSELMMDKKTSYNSFFLMCLLNGLIVYVVNRELNLYMKFQGITTTQEDSDHIFYKSPDGSYSIDLDSTREKMEAIESTMVRIDFGDKPMKSITAYKIDDLVTMAKQMDPEIEKESSKKWKKTELYQFILNRIAKF